MITADTEMIVIDLDDPENNKGRLKQIGGSQSDHWNNVLINQTAKTLWVKYSDKEIRDLQYKATVAALRGIGPKDEIEGMIAAQMLASYNAAMECYRRAMADEASFEERQANLNQANKLVRSYVVLVEALNRHRGKVQRVQVEHVTVHAGGQAIVGAVEAQGIAKPMKTEERPHALGHAPSPTVRRKNEIQREAVPIASNGKRQVLCTRRNVAGGQKG
jgi:hypothetical protein